MEFPLSAVWENVELAGIWDVSEKVKELIRIAGTGSTKSIYRYIHLRPFDGIAIYTP